MDQGLEEGPTTARWLAWATVVLLAVGVVSASIVDAGGPGADARVVSAAGGTPGTVDVSPGSTTTVASQPPATLTPPSTVARSTTVPKAAAAVLAAIASTAPPTTQRPPATTTTRPPVSSTTVPTTATTSTTVPGKATVTLANRHPNVTFRVTLDRQVFELKPFDEKRDVVVTLGPNGNYVIEAHAVVDDTCGQGDSGAFQAGGRYLVEILAAPGGCGTKGIVSNFDLIVQPDRTAAAPR